MKDIASAITTIQSKLADAGGASRAFVEIRDNEREVILGGNRAGLLQIALYALELAQKDVVGSHIHLDEHSGADIAEKALVLRRSADEA